MTTNVHHAARYLAQLEIAVGSFVLNKGAKKQGDNMQGDPPSLNVLLGEFLDNCARGPPVAVPNAEGVLASSAASAEKAPVPIYNASGHVSGHALLEENGVKPNAVVKKNVKVVKAADAPSEDTAEDTAAKIEYAAVTKVESDFVTMRRLFEDQSEGTFQVPIEEFTEGWELMTDKAELDKMSECTQYRHQGASNNSEYMRLVLASRAIHFLERARMHLGDLDSDDVSTVDGAAMFRQAAKTDFRIFLKPRVTVQAANALAPWSVHLLPLTTNVKVVKAAEAKPRALAVQFSASAASADTEFTVMLLPNTIWPKHGNAAETAFIEPFWLVKRLPTNEEQDVAVNLVLKRLNFTVTELAQRPWISNEFVTAWPPSPPALPRLPPSGLQAKAKAKAPSGPRASGANDAAEAASAVAAKSATNALISVPLLTNPEEIPQGAELVWRDASWTKEESHGKKKARRGPVMITPPSKCAKAGGKSAKTSS